MITRRVTPARVTAVLLLLTLAASAFAEDESPSSKALSITLRTLAPFPRSHGPARAELNITWKGQGWLEGRAEIVLFDQFEKIATIRTPSLTLAPRNDDQTFRFLLPPLPAGFSLNSLLLHSLSL